MRVARLASGEAIGLTMLKLLKDDVGYVYYIAVVPAFRGRGMGRRLLLDSLERLAKAGAKEVYATVGEHNVESTALFLGRGFKRTDLGQVSKKYGALRALAMYRSMWVVPGEVVMVKDARTLGDAAAAPPPLPSG
ncbi:MAG: GNAT family N-acetyltransferase [Nitrososphaerales archaeon]